jgi:hypothetical protein
MAGGGRRMIEQIKQALEKSTKGKWEVNDFDTMYSAEVISEYPPGVFNGIASGMYVPDAHLIANSAEWLRYLIGEVERLDIAASIDVSLGNTVAEMHKEIEELQKALEEAKKYLSNDNAGYAEYIINQAIERSETK